MGAAIKLFFAKVIWPWIIANVWPIIQQYLIQLAAEAVRWVMMQAKDWVVGTFNNRGKQAEAKVEEEERRAEEHEEGSPDWREHKARADVWRNVAEQYRQDNEGLKKKLEEVEAEAVRDIHEDVKELTPDLDITGKTPTVKVKGTVHSLPTINSKKGIGKCN